VELLGLHGLGLNSRIETILKDFLVFSNLAGQSVSKEITTDFLTHSYQLTVNFHPVISNLTSPCHMYHHVEDQAVCKSI